MKYQPKVINGKVKNTGWPIDGHELSLSLWDYDNYECYHLWGYPPESDEAVMQTMYQTEKEAGLCVYDSLEEFKAAWMAQKWEAAGVFTIPLENVDVLQVLRKEVKDCRQVNAIKKQKYAWSFDEDAEYWNSCMFDSIEECIAEAKVENELADYAHKYVYVGWCEEFKVHVNAADVLERLEEDAYEEFGEFAYGWDALCYKEDKADGSLDELSEELTKIVVTWLEKKHRKPGFCNIGRIEEFKL